MDPILSAPEYWKRYLCFTLSHDPKQAVERFRQKYGDFPMACLKFAGLLWLGPIPTQAPAPDPIPTQPEPVYELVQLEMSL